MARPALTPISSGAQGWDGDIDDNFDVLADAPLPVKERSDITSLTALQTAYPANSYDRCAIWINHATYGYVLCWSDGTNWRFYGDQKRAKRELTGTTTQAITDQFVRYSGAGSVDYDFLAAASWAGCTVEIRNDAGAAINLDPNGTENINGSSTSLSLAVGSTARVYSDGTALWAAIMA
jgi:hypothetical protein